MNLKEKILSKLDYNEISQRVYNMLENEIIEDALENINEEEIAYDEYKYEFLESARETVLLSIGNEICFSDIKDDFEDTIDENLQ